MPPTLNRQKYRDEHGFDWTFETVLTDGGVEVYLSCPQRCVERTRLVPEIPHRNRPSVDADVPLPLETL